MNDMKILWLVFWFLFSAGVALIAQGKGRQPFVWFLVAFILSPVIALLLMLLFPGDDTSTATPITTLRGATARELLAQLEEKFSNGVLQPAEIEDLKALARRDPPPPRARAAPVASVPSHDAGEFTRPCPNCGQLVHPKATTCMHCWAKIMPAVAGRSNRTFDSDGSRRGMTREPSE